MFLLKVEFFSRTNVFKFGFRMSPNEKRLPPARISCVRKPSNFLCKNLCKYSITKQDDQHHNHQCPDKEANACLLSCCSSQ